MHGPPTMPSSPSDSSEGNAPIDSSVLPDAAAQGQISSPKPGTGHALALDVVTVPDFLGADPSIFEIRSLFFLASWIASGNAESRYRLHLACIGEPPSSVRDLADRAGARISVHATKTIEGVRFANKFRGFEVNPSTEHLLLVDTDILFLGFLDGLNLSPDCVAVAPAFRNRVPLWVWEEAYQAAGLPMPEERIPSQAAELGCVDLQSRRKRSKARPRTMPPYYNSGVIFTPWSVPLAEEWEKTIRAVNPRLEKLSGMPREVLRSDQVAFAVALHSLKSRGQSIERLPDAFHAHRYHLYRRKFSLEEVGILHMTGSFGDGTRRADRRAWTRMAANRFLQQIREEYVSSDIRGRPIGGFFRFLLPAVLEGLALRKRLDQLYLDFIESA